LIIVLTGVDGSGKSVVARELAKHLRRKKVKVRIVWVKSLHTLAYLIYRFYRKFWGIEYIINPRNRIVEHYTTAWMKRLGTIWGIIEFISVLPWILIVHLYTFLNYTVICDRFLVDFITTVLLRLRKPLWAWKSIIGRFLIALHRKIITIHLRISYSTVLKRRPEIEYNPYELKTLMTLYSMISKYVNAYEIINEGSSLKAIVESILNNIGRVKKNSYKN